MNKWRNTELQSDLNYPGSSNYDRELYQRKKYYNGYYKCLKHGNVDIRDKKLQEQIEEVLSYLSFSK